MNQDDKLPTQEQMERDEAFGETPVTRGGSVKLVAPSTQPLIINGKEYRDGDLVSYRRTTDKLLAKLTFHERMVVARGEMVCPECNGSHISAYVHYVSHRTQYDTCEGCPCEFHKNFWRYYSKMVQERDRKSPLLKPSNNSTASLEFQAKAIACMLEHWMDGIAYFGPPGVGKSCLMSAQFFHLLWYTTVDNKWRHARDPWEIWKTSVPRLIAEDLEYIRRNGDGDYEDRRLLPIETLWAVSHPHLFLDEMDKTGNVTDHRRALLFNFIDAIDQKEGQLVLASNLTPSEFEAQFDGPIAIRVARLCWRINYFTETITPPMGKES